MKPIKAIIVDDERMARQNLHRLVEVHCPEVEVVALCEDAQDAKKTILARSPQLVFLDIKMPDESGLELLKSLPDREFIVIFVTAHAQHALEAFDQAAVDYLLKPIHSSRLKKAVKRVVDLLAHKADLGNVGKGLSTPAVSHSKIPLPTLEGIELFDLDQIVRFQANGSYSMVYLSSGDKFLVSRNLKKIELLTGKGNFIRVHHAHLVNLLFIKKYSRQDGGFLVLKDGSEVEVSRRKKSELLQLLGSFL